MATLPTDVNIPAKRGGRGGRKGLKNVTPNETNIEKGLEETQVVVAETKKSKKKSNVAVEDADIPSGLEETHVAIDAILSPAKSKKSKKKSSTIVAADVPSDLDELMARFEKLQIEKEKAEELLKEREELLKQKDEEIENREIQQKKLRKEVHKLQKLKEFNPTTTIPVVVESKKTGAEVKKPCPSYVHFCKEQWNEMKKERPELGFKDISNVLGAKWKNLSAEERRPYDAKYQQEKETYLKITGVDKREKEALKLLEEDQLQKTAMELLDQYVQFRRDQNEEKKKPKKEKDPSKPKKPMSAFFLFSSNRRQNQALLPESEKKSAVEMAKIAGEEWKSMREELKAPFEKQAKEHMEEYVKQIEEYKEKKTAEGETVEREEEEKMKIHKQEALKLLKKKEKTDNMIKKKSKEKLEKKKQQPAADPNRPKKPAGSFILFSKETRKALQEERPELGASSLSALVSVKWKELGEEGKKKWNEKAASAMAAYKKEIEDYNSKSNKQDV